MKKILTIAALASTTTFGLFAFMAYLVNNEQILPVESLPDVMVEIAQLPDEQPPQVKPPFKNEPPPAPKPMPRTLVSPVETIVEGGYHYESSSLKLTGGKTKLNFASNKSDGDARPIVRINPTYPITAARDGIEGWVKLRFDVDPVGAVSNIEVIAAEPKRIFNSAAKKALRKWKYRAKSTGGKSIAQQGLTVQLDFNIDQQG
jgi:protein TonB